MKLLQPDFDALKKKAAFNEVTRKLYNEAMSQADKIVEANFPSEPVKERSYIRKIDGQYTEEYLGILQEYDDTSWLYERAIRKLAFAYKMTGEQKYLDKFEQAIEGCLKNPFWGPKENEYDHCSSRLLRSLCVSLTWLGDSLSKDISIKVRTRMKAEVLGFKIKYRRMGDDYPMGPNDHQSKDMSGAGCAAWFLMASDTEMKQCFDRFTYLFRDKLIEETIGEDGGWPDGWLCVLYALMDVIALFEVIKDAKGEDLVLHPRMQRTCDFFIGSVHQHKCYPNEEVVQTKYAYCHVLFWMAAAYQRRDMQFLAENAVMQGLTDLDFSDYAFICYDEKLQAEELCQGGAMFTRSVGWGRLGWGTNTNSVYLWLKSGSADAFCRNNQNGLYLTAFGRQLFSDVTLSKVGYKKLWKCVYDDGLWNTKCSTALLVNGQNQLKNRYGEDWGPIMKFHNPNREKWGDVDAWWFDFEEPKAPYGRIVGSKNYEDRAVLVGRADRCYGDLLSGFTRACMMTRDGIIVIVDTLIPNGNAKNFQFRANTAYTFSIKDKNRAAIRASDVRSDIIFLYNGKYEISVDKWAFNPGPGNYLTGNFELYGKKAQLITIMRPYCDNREHTLNAALDGESLKICFDDMNYSYDLHFESLTGGNDEYI